VTADLLALADRCEKATGPVRALDVEILVAIDWREPEWEEGERTAREMAERHGLPWLVSRAVEGYNSTWRHLPRLTASIDAAMTLVPEGWVLGDLYEEAPLSQWVAELRKWHLTSFDKVVFSDSTPDQHCATAALALCAAALRARAAQDQPERKEDD
jgi:hypothetical protein